MRTGAQQGGCSRRSLRRLASTLATLVVLAAPAAGADEAAARLLAAATQRQEAGELEAALAGYRQIADQFPGSDEAATALLRIARGLRATGQAAQAEAAANRLIAEYARWPVAADAMVLVGELQRDRATSWRELEAARDTFARVELLFDAAEHPTLAARSAAGVHRGSLALLAGAVDSAAAHFLDVLEREPRSEWTAEALLGLATARLAEGDWEAAAEALQAALDDDPGGRAGLHAARHLVLLERFALVPERGGKRWSRAAMLTTPVALERPEGITITADESLVVADGGQDVVLVIGVGGRAAGRWPGRDVKRPSVDALGEILLPTDDAVAFAAGRPRQTFAAPDKDRTLEDIAAVERNPFGDWFVAGSRSEGLMLYKADGKSGRSLTDRSVEPADLATDGRRRVYLLDSRGGQVLRYGADGSGAKTVARGSWGRAQALATDALGNLYVLDGEANRIEVYDGAGARVEGLGPTLPGGIELRRPTDLAVGADGRIYVTDSRLGGVVVID